VDDFSGDAALYRDIAVLASAEQECSNKVLDGWFELKCGAAEGLVRQQIMTTPPLSLAHVAFGALLTATMGCAPSVPALVARGELLAACEATDFGHSPELVDRLARESRATLVVRVLAPEDTLAAAGLATKPHDASWLAIEAELSVPAGPSPLAELSLQYPKLRGEGWLSLVGGGLGDHYLALTGKQMPSPGQQATFADVLQWSRDAVLAGDATARSRLAGILQPGERPEDLYLAERLADWFGSDERATPGTSAHVAGKLVRSDFDKEKRARLGLTIRYAQADPASGAHCTQLEHLVFDLPPGPDLRARVATLFPAGPRPLAELRREARVRAFEGEDPLAE
jgi:hypothetical protein